MFAISLFIPIVTTLIPTFVVTYKLGLINTYPGLILPIAAQTGFGTLLFRQYISQMPRGAVRRRPHRRRELVDDPPSRRRAARQAGDRGVPRDLGADRLEHVPVAARRREGGSLQVLTQTLGVGRARPVQGQVTPQNVIFASVVIVTLPMIVAFLARAAGLRPRSHRLGGGVSMVEPNGSSSADGDFVGRVRRRHRRGAGHRRGDREGPRGTGAHVVLNGRRRETLEAVCATISAAGRLGRCRVGDVTDLAHLDELMAIAAGSRGHPRRSSSTTPASPGRPRRWSRSRLEEWNETIAVNLTGVFLACKAALPYLERAEHGKIVNIGSVTGKQPLPNRSPYAAAKLGVVGLTRTLAHEVGPSGISVNLISPWLVEGERLGDVLVVDVEGARAHARTSSAPR